MEKTKWNMTKDFFSWACEGIEFGLKKNLMHSSQLYGVFLTDPPYYDNIGYADLSDFILSGFRNVSLT